MFLVVFTAHYRNGVNRLWFLRAALAVNKSRWLRWRGLRVESRDLPWEEFSRCWFERRGLRGSRSAALLLKWLSTGSSSSLSTPLDMQVSRGDRSCCRFFASMYKMVKEQIGKEWQQVTVAVQKEEEEAA